MNVLAHPDTPPKQVAERKSAMEDIETWLEEMDHVAKKVTIVITQFWGIVVQAAKLEKLTKQLQEAEEKLATMKSALRTMSPVISIT